MLEFSINELCNKRTARKIYRESMHKDCYGLLKSMTLTTLEEKHAATRDSSIFQATSKMSPLPLKLLITTPSRTFQMYS